MITKINIKATQNGKELVDLALKSTDTKPTTGIMNGSLCMEVDTGSIYAYDEGSSEWAEIGSSGGGGGGGGSSDFSTAEVTVTGADSSTIFGGMATVIEYPDEDIAGTYGSWEAEEDGVFPVVLYKGYCYGTLQTFGTPTATGNANITPAGGDNVYNIVITGDCTITVANA